MVDIADPSFDPHKLSTEDKIKLVQQSDGLLVDILSGCEIRDLDLSCCTSLTHLPDGLEVEGYLWLIGCTSLSHLPDGLKVGRWLNLYGCTSLTHLPDVCEVGGFLYLYGCTGLQHYRDKKIKGVKGKIVW